MVSVNRQDYIQADNSTDILVLWTLLEHSKANQHLKSTPSSETELLGKGGSAILHRTDKNLSRFEKHPTPSTYFFSAFRFGVLKCILEVSLRIRVDSL